MAKKEKMEEKGSICSWCPCWSKEDWFWGVVSTVSLYFLIWYTLKVLNASGSLWTNALVLIVLLHVAAFTCPIVRKHYL